MGGWGDGGDGGMGGWGDGGMGGWGDGEVGNFGFWILDFGLFPFRSSLCYARATPYVFRSSNIFASPSITIVVDNCTAIED
ncbi:hypothetical protein E1H13_08950 [Nodosilinea sp. P-1105]|nr:hypothetical protein [Nodosilinea sp. P-1105]